MFFDVWKRMPVVSCEESSGPQGILTGHCHVFGKNFSYSCCAVLGSYGF